MPRTRIRKVVVEPARAAAHAHEVTVRLKGGVVLRGWRRTKREAEQLKSRLAGKAARLESAFEDLAAAGAEADSAMKVAERKAAAADRASGRVWALLGGQDNGVTYSRPKRKRKARK